MSEGNVKQILTLGNSIIGVSILAMPYCFKQCGLVLGIMLLILSGYVNRLNCHFLIKSAISTKRRSYEFLAFHIFGPMGKFAIEVIQIGFLFGICVSFFVIAGDLGPKILVQILDIEYTDRFRAVFLCGLCFLIVLPLSLLKNTDSLASISAISITFYVLLVLKIVSDSWRHIVTGSWQAKVELWRPAGVLQALPIMSLALACQTNLFSIYENLPDPSLGRMNAVVAGAINLCSSVYILVGFFGYVALHDVTFGGNILVHLIPSPISRWINIGFVMSIAFGFPLVVYPCRTSVNSLLFRRSGSALELPQNYIPETRFKCITFCILAAAMGIGIVIPSIEVVLGLLGSTMGTAIAILFPSVMFIKNTSRNNLEKMSAQATFLLGIVLLVCGTYMNLYAVDQLAQGTQLSPPVSVPAAISTPAVLIQKSLANTTAAKEAAVLVAGLPAVEKAAVAADEVRKEPAVPEPPADPDQKPPDAAVAAVAANDRRDDHGQAAVEHKSDGDEKAADPDRKRAGAKLGADERKHATGDQKNAGVVDRKLAEDDGKLEGAGRASEEANRRSDVGGDRLDAGALRKEAEERRRDDALKPDPQQKEIETKQEAVLQKLEETHKEQKELLKEQKELLQEMKKQKAERQAEQAVPPAGQQPIIDPAAQQQSVGNAAAQQQPMENAAVQQQSMVNAAPQPAAAAGVIQQPGVYAGAPQHDVAARAAQPRNVAAQPLSQQQQFVQNQLPLIQGQLTALNQQQAQPAPLPLPLANQALPPANQALPLANQALPLANQALPLTNQALPLANQALPLANQALPLANQALPLANQALPLANQALPLANQALPLTNQAVPLVNRPLPLANQALPLTNQGALPYSNQAPAQNRPAAAGGGTGLASPEAGGGGQPQAPLAGPATGDRLERLSMSFGDQQVAGGKQARSAERVRRQAPDRGVEDEMLVRLAENWAAVEAAGGRATR